MDKLPVLTQRELAHMKDMATIDRRINYLKSKYISTEITSIVRNLEIVRDKIYEEVS